MKVLVTGGCGFIGSNYVRMTLKSDPDAHVVNLDALTYAGNLENLTEVANNPRYSLVHGDIADARLLDGLFEEEKFDLVVNFAAESHVDRSIQDATAFLRTNVSGTYALLQASRKHKVQRFLQVSTDEVYGSLGPTGRFSEGLPLDPRSPYSASKASADHMVMAFFHTFGLNVIITRCSNNYGPFQFPEKLIPLVITNALEGKEIPVYGDGMQIRDWIHVDDHCRAIETALFYGVPGEIYNIGGNSELSNLEVVRMILRLTDGPSSLIKHVEDRPGHDRRYAMDISKIKRELGWSPEKGFEEGLRETVTWYQQNNYWWKKITSGEYQRYYDSLYAGRAIHDLTTNHDGID